MALWIASRSLSSGARSRDPLARNDGLSGSGGERLARIGANPLDHGTQAVGALRRQVLSETEFVEHCDGIGREDSPRRMAGIQRQQDRNQAADDVGGAVAEIIQSRLAVAAAIGLLRKPDLAGAAIA